MAISKGFESKEAQEFKRYIGVAPMFIKAVNPTKAEHEALFNTTLEEAPKYLGTIADNNGNEIPNARIQVVFQPDVEKIGFDMPLVTMALFVQNKYRYNKDMTKVQVIDKYGRTTWATVEDAKAHKIPLDKNGNPLNIDKDYRPAYVGEEDLMNFVKAYLCIPEVTSWDANSRTWVPNTKVKPEECECRFDNLDKIFKGDFSEIQDALGFQPTNKVKVLLGVRTDVETGRLYQSVYTRKFLRNASNNYSSLDKEIQEMIANAVANGRTVNTEYQVGPVHEYSVEATTFTPNEAPTPSEELPFEPSSNSSSPWD